MGIVVNGKTVKWASFNLGASKPEEYGDYYAWGEREPYYKEGHSQDEPCLAWKNGKEKGYNWESYKWYAGKEYTLTKFTKYNYNNSYGIIDNIKSLEFEDDAARVELGGNWRIPTKEELDALCKDCTWEWTTLNGIYGEMVTGPNGNSIFLPAAGYFGGRALWYQGFKGFYWSCSLNEINDAPEYATYLRFDIDYTFPHKTDREFTTYTMRVLGCSIRPVTE